MGSDSKSDNSSSKEDEQQLGRLKLSAVIEKEKANEARYLGLYGDLIQSHLQVLRQSTGKHPNDHDYSHEASILKKAIDVERKAWVSGIVIGCLVFVSVRKLPYWLTKMVGGDAKLQAMHQADIEAAKLPNAHLKRMGSFLFEGTFTFWAGWRAYHAAINMQSDDKMYDDLARIPLSQGKSQVSDALCQDWIHLTHHKIPVEFWNNLKHGEASDMQNESLLKAIYSFSENCVKRKRYESLLSKHKKGDFCIPSPGVPENILELSVEEVEKMLTAA